VTEFSLWRFIDYYLGNCTFLGSFCN